MNKLPIARDDDTFALSPRGACLVAAIEYEAAFGPDPDGKSASDIADEMVACFTPAMIDFIQGCGND